MEGSNIVVVGATDEVVETTVEVGVAVVVEATVVVVGTTVEVGVAVVVEVTVVVEVAVVVEASVVVGATVSEEAPQAEAHRVKLRKIKKFLTKSLCRCKMTGSTFLPVIQNSCFFTENRFCK